MCKKRATEGFLFNKTFLWSLLEMIKGSLHDKLLVVTVDFDYFGDIVDLNYSLRGEKS